MAMTRRQFMAAAAAAGVLAHARPGSSGMPFALAEQLPLGIKYDPAPFQCGVASGDPAPDSVVLWTRLTQEPLRGGGMPDVPVPVQWVMAEDAALTRVVQSGTVTAQPALAHAVHVDVRGLEAGRVYWYVFRANGVTSRLGRTKTAPVGPTARVRFGFGSCQNFPTGRYGAYADAVKQDLDFFVHLGDYVYESGGSGENGTRAHTGGETLTLEDYRNRYALYRGDPQLRAAHAHMPFVVTWDDHEVSDNYAGMTPHPLTRAALPDTTGGTDAAFAARRTSAYQAYYDMMPLRVPDGLPLGPDLRIYRGLQFGDLLSMPVIDTRQYRDVQAYPETPGVGVGVADPDRTILGLPQRAWLLDELASEETAWRCVANQVAFAAIRLAGLPPAVSAALPEDPQVARMFGLAGDTWDGYQHDRTLVQEQLARRGDAATIVLTGDIHSFWTSEIKADYNDPGSETLGVEFITGAITSGGNGSANNTTAFQTAVAAGGNTHIRFTEHEHKGYGICDVTPSTWRTTYRRIEDVDVPNARFVRDAVFEVQRDRPGVTTLQT